MPDAAAVYLRTAEGAMTQCERLLLLLREVGEEGVTPILALNELGCFRLAARIFDLKEQGHDIEAGELVTPGGKRVARYVLREQPEQIEMFG